MMGNLVATTGPDVRKFFTPAAGSRKNSWLVKSTRAAIVHASFVVIARESGAPSIQCTPDAANACHIAHFVVTGSPACAGDDAYRDVRRRCGRRRPLASRRCR